MSQPSPEQKDFGPSKRSALPVSALDLESPIGTDNVGSREWLQASKDIEIQGYLPSERTVDIAPASPEEDTQHAPTGHEIPVLSRGDFEEALDKVSRPVRTPDSAS